MRPRIALTSLIIVYGLSSLNTLNKLLSSTPRASQDHLEAPLDVRRHWNISKSMRQTLHHDAPYHRSETLLSDSMPGKPYIILHLGPAKTGTSTLQNEMTAWKDQVLELDNVLYGGAYYASGEHLGRSDVQGHFMDVNFECNGAMACQVTLESICPQKQNFERALAKYSPMCQSNAISSPTLLLQWNELNIQQRNFKYGIRMETRTWV